MYRSATDHLALTHKSDGVVSYHHLLSFLTIASLWLTTSIASVVADQQIYHHCWTAFSTILLP